MTDECITTREIVTGDDPDALATGFEELNAVGGNTESTNNKYNARMPTERYAAEYNMNHKNRGLALIFNHEYFDIPSLKPRAGTNVDCENLRKTLKQLDFEVVIYKDCKLMEIIKRVENVFLISAILELISCSFMCLLYKSK